MSMQCEVTAKKAAGAEMCFFEHSLALWVVLYIVIGQCAVRGSAFH